MILNLIISAIGFSATWAAPTSGSHLKSVIFPTREHGHVHSAGKHIDTIQYNLGNPVLTGDVGVYLVWYGAWAEKQKAVIEDFINGVGNSSWYAVNKSRWLMYIGSSWSTD